MIIPMELCKQSLSFSETQITKLKAKQEEIYSSKQSLEGRSLHLRNPRALFDFNKYYSIQNESGERT